MTLLFAQCGTEVQTINWAWCWGCCHHVLVLSLQVHAYNGSCNRYSLNGESSEGWSIWRCHAYLQTKLIFVLPLLPDIWQKCVV